MIVSNIMDGTAFLLAVLLLKDCLDGGAPQALAIHGRHPWAPSTGWSAMKLSHLKIADGLVFFAHDRGIA
jgi:hypothetical protein